MEDVVRFWAGTETLSSSVRSKKVDAGGGAISGGQALAVEDDEGFVSTDGCTKNPSFFVSMAMLASASALAFSFRGTCSHVHFKPLVLRISVA